MIKSTMLTILIAVGAVVLTSTVAPASAARRHVGWQNAAAAGVAAAVMSVQVQTAMACLNPSC